MISAALWQKAWLEVGVTEADQSLYERLIACYSEPQRKYHTLQHLAECFAHLDDLRNLTEHPAEVELALWFHDAVYDTRASDNEERSAVWAYEAVRSYGIDAESAERIRSLILATKHRAVPEGCDAEILIDVDLAILGASPVRFDEYEQQVRDEYSWVAELMFRIERRKVLQSFLDRQAIYSTELFRMGREQQARDNLSRSISQLGDG